ncbi:MAG: NUDIX domain-containing protein [Candidatus Eremiobacterota bacterium]
MDSLLAALPAPSRVHVKARRELGPGYPARFPVPDDRVAWAVAYPEYAPPYYVDPVVLRNSGRWADPEPWLPELVVGRSLEAPVRDRDGRHLNPRGRTGLQGRGRLGKWGANLSADPVITRLMDGVFQAVLIQRRDCGQWALPGGMLDRGESFLQAAERELAEETGLSLPLGSALEVSAGYVDDPRNTDHAWMESTAFHLHLGPQAAGLRPRGADDAGTAAWVRLDLECLLSLYASHWETVARAVAAWERREGVRVSRGGQVL